LKYSAVFLLLASLTGSLTAVPRFALLEDISCATCHAYEGGGAGRLSYGKDFVREGLVRYDSSLPWDAMERELPVFLGFDARYELVQTAAQNLRQFPMQLALYAGAELGNLVAHGEINRIQNKFRYTGGLRYAGLPLESWLALERELPALGWRLDDHTVFTRGGNLSTQGLAREGLPYTPYLEPPSLVVLGSAPLPGMAMTLFVGTPFLESSLESQRGPLLAVKTGYTWSSDMFTIVGGAAWLQEAQIQGTTLSWGASIGDWVWLGELDWLDQWPAEDKHNFAMLQQLSLRFFPGMDLIGRYEFFDPDRQLRSGAIKRGSLGVELFLIPGLELKLSYRKSQLDLTDFTGNSQGQLLGQLHLYL